MAFRITIEDVLAPVHNDVNESGEIKAKLYEQTVETLDLRRVIDAINYKPRVYKQRAKKGDQA